MITDLDLAWERINAIGGYAESEFDKGINSAVSSALDIIEELGGSDPAAKRAAMIAGRDLEKSGAA